MSSFWLTLIFAVILIVVAAVFLGIGVLLTGKKKFSCKRCGTPEKNCSICKKKKDH